jgi:hypothetical protein
MLEISSKFNEKNNLYKQEDYQTSKKDKSKENYT